MFVVLLVLSLIVFLLLTLSLNLKPINLKMKREKMSSFECGFDPNHNMRNAFSLRFFIITVIFLLFDVEVMIMLPIPLGNSMFNASTFLAYNFVLFCLLLGSLIIEWRQGALEWY